MKFTPNNTGGNERKVAALPPSPAPSGSPPGASPTSPGSSEAPTISIDGEQTQTVQQDDFGRSAVGGEAQHPAGTVLAYDSGQQLGRMGAAVALHLDAKPLGQGGSTVVRTGDLVLDQDADPAHQVFLPVLPPSGSVAVLVPKSAEHGDMPAYAKAMEALASLTQTELIRAAYHSEVMHGGSEQVGSGASAYAGEFSLEEWRQRSVRCDLMRVYGFAPVHSAFSDQDKAVAASDVAGADSTLVMAVVAEQVKGKTLESVVKDQDRAQSLQEVLDIACGVALRASDLYDHGLVNPDIKSSNVMVEWKEVAGVLPAQGAGVAGGSMQPCDLAALPIEMQQAIRQEVDRQQVTERPLRPTERVTVGRMNDGTIHFTTTIPEIQRAVMIDLGAVDACADLDSGVKMKGSVGWTDFSTQADICLPGRWKSPGGMSRAEAASRMMAWSVAALVIEGVTGNRPLKEECPRGNLTRLTPEVVKARPDRDIANVERIIGENAGPIAAQHVGQVLRRCMTADITQRYTIEQAARAIAGCADALGVEAGRIRARE